MRMLVEPKNDDHKLIFGWVNKITHEWVVVVVKFMRIETVVYEVFVKIASKLLH
jgi:hypothetical protein